MVDAGSLLFPIAIFTVDTRSVLCDAENKLYIHRFVIIIIIMFMKD